MCLKRGRSLFYKCDICKEIFTNFNKKCTYSRNCFLKS